MNLLTRELSCKKGKDYAEVLLFGDLHLGADNCMIEKAKENLDYCFKNGIYVYTMGDLIESSNRYSVGSAVYHQMNPQEQIEKIVELLEPLAKAGLLLNIMSGNHELRVDKEAGVDVSKMIAKMLNVPYTGDSCWNLFRVGNQNYTMYALHGASGSRFSYTKLKAVIDILHSFEANIVAMGHVHELMIDWAIKQYVDLRSKTVKEKKILAVLTGHYLSYSNSYASSKGMPISKTGSPKLELGGKEHSIHCSM